MSEIKYGTIYRAPRGREAGVVHVDHEGEVSLEGFAHSGILLPTRVGDRVSLEYHADGKPRRWRTVSPQDEPEYLDPAKFLLEGRAGNLFLHTCGTVPSGKFLVSIRESAATQTPRLFIGAGDTPEEAAHNAIRSYRAGEDATEFVSRARDILIAEQPKTENEPVLVTPGYEPVPEPPTLITP